MAQRFLDLDEIGLKRHGEFIQRDQQILVLQSLLLMGHLATPNLFVHSLV